MPCYQQGCVLRRHFNWLLVNDGDLAAISYCNSCGIAWVALCKLRVRQECVDPPRLAAADPDKDHVADLNLASELRGHVRSPVVIPRSEEHTSELQSREKLVCRLLLEKKKKTK